MLIYLLTFSDGRQYVGQTLRPFSVRLSQHRRMVKYGSPLPVHCAWRDHGEPTIEIVGEYSDLESLHAAERNLIAKLGTLRPNGYNVSIGGDTAPSKSAEVAAKISEKAKGRTHTEETRARIAAGNRARWEDPEYRARVAAGVATSFTPERRAKLSETAKRVHKGKLISEEHRQALRDRVVSDETRAKMSDAAKRRKREPRSEETCKKLAASVERSWADPEIKAKRSAAIRAALAARKAEIWTPERRAAVAERNRVRWAKAREAKGKSSIA